MSDYTVDTYERNGLDVEIYYDTDAENPLEWTTPEERGAWFVMSHKRYNLPNELEQDFDAFDDWNDIAKSASAGKPYKFVSWYEHSGIAVRLQDNLDLPDQWDSGIVGFIVGNTNEDIEREFEPWKAYTEGEVYGYMITNPRNGEVVDSCCGFYGRDDVEQCANGEADGFKHPHDAAYAKNANVIHGGK